MAKKMNEKSEVNEVKKWSKKLIDIEKQKMAAPVSKSTNSLWDKMKTVTNKTYTENNALTLKSTNSEVLNLFSTGGASRKMIEDVIRQKVSRALAEDFIMGVKCLFHLRDVRQGQGERRLFRIGLEVLSDIYPDKAQKIIPCIIEYGRVDDMFSLNNVDIKEYILDNIDKNHLISKWLPSENSGTKSKIKAKAIRKYLGLTSVQYRKMLSIHRKSLNLVETNITQKEYSKIDYEQVPSKAMLKYRKAFKSKDEDRYSEYLKDVDKGKKKINTKTLYPYEIVSKAKKSNDDSLQTLWNNLPDYTRNENAIVVADTSGSMAGTPIDVSISLAIYFAERNKGLFRNKFITFSESPELQEVKGKNLYQKIINLQTASWDMNTNIQKVFDLILNTSIKNKVPENELPKTIYIISDMEFDMATEDNDETNFEAIKKKYTNSGYQMPQLVFWNVESRHDNVPVTENEQGVALVSGCSPIVFSTVMNKVTPTEHMHNVLNSQRYQMIDKCLS